MPTVERYLEAANADTNVGRALTLHYPATNGEGPDVCAVCYFWPGTKGNLPDLVPEAWPCPTVRALMGGS